MNLPVITIYYVDFVDKSESDSTYRTCLDTVLWKNKKSEFIVAWVKSMTYTKSFMQITFRYEFVQVFFHDLPALVKHLDGCKCYRSLKKKKFKLYIQTALKPIRFILFLTSLPVLEDFKKLSNSLSYSVLALYKVVTSEQLEHNFVFNVIHIKM